MISGISLIGETLIQKAKNSEKLNILVLGTGAGVLPMFLSQHLAVNLESLTTIDINPTILKIATEFFGFNLSSNLKSEIADAYEYIFNAKPDTFDIIFMDLNYEEDDVKVSPPKKFFEPDLVNQLHVISKPTALIAINTIIDNTLKAKLFT